MAYDGSDFDGAIRAAVVDGLPGVESETPDQRYRKLLEHSPDAICVHQMGHVVYVNAAAVRWMKASS
ncbi:MAG: hypothetical protein JWR46_1540, partial [Mycobacterium sp.]|nr:hypothetical protein [Mycobacterium sp.]